MVKRSFILLLISSINLVYLPVFSAEECKDDPTYIKSFKILSYSKYNPLQFKDRFFISDAEYNNFTLRFDQSASPTNIEAIRVWYSDETLVDTIESINSPKSVATVNDDLHYWMDIPSNGIFVTRYYNKTKRHIDFYHFVLFNVYKLEERLIKSSIIIDNDGKTKFITWYKDGDKIKAFGGYQKETNIKRYDLAITEKESEKIIQLNRFNSVPSIILAIAKDRYIFIHPNITYTLYKTNKFAPLNQFSTHPTPIYDSDGKTLKSYYGIYYEISKPYDYKLMIEHVDKTFHHYDLKIKCEIVTDCRVTAKFNNGINRHVERFSRVTVDNDIQEGSFVGSVNKTYSYVFMTKKESQGIITAKDVIEGVFNPEISIVSTFPEQDPSEFIIRTYLMMYPKSKKNKNVAIRLRADGEDLKFISLLPNGDTLHEITSKLKLDDLRNNRMNDLPVFLVYLDGKNSNSSYENTPVIVFYQNATYSTSKLIDVFNFKEPDFIPTKIKIKTICGNEVTITTPKLPSPGPITIVVSPAKVLTEKQSSSSRESFIPKVNLIHFFILFKLMFSLFCQT